MPINRINPVSPIRSTRNLKHTTVEIDQVIVTNLENGRSNPAAVITMNDTKLVVALGASRVTLVRQTKEKPYVGTLAGMELASWGNTRSVSI
jgi:hypothetical protein